ncbi:MAG: lipase family protein, partial [Nocardioidaceae bacterium]
MRPVRTRLMTIGGSAALIAALVATAGAAPAAEQVAPAASIAATDDFYDTPATLPDGDGDVIRDEPSTFYLDPAKLIEADAHVRRVMYKSTDAHGDPIAVTGTVLVPEHDWIGDGERPLIGYAAGTQGLGDQCAPSRQLAAGSEYEGAFLEGLLTRGYAVALTDYEALGTEGVHTYMARASQGHAVLDAVRAARNLGLDGVPADGPVALSGYSQGGGASAAAAELAADYAPDLGVDAAYAGAVPADLPAVGRNLDGGLYAAF